MNTPKPARVVLNIIVGIFYFCGPMWIGLFMDGFMDGFTDGAYNESFFTWISVALAVILFIYTLAKQKDFYITK